MFVVAMKTTRTRLAALGAVLLALMAVTLAAARSQPAAVATAAGGESGRVALLQELGYTVSGSWTAVQEVAIPTQWDEAWKTYNEMQQACGYDLTPYQGQRVKSYTYDLVSPAAGSAVQAHLYEYRGEVIAGDVTGTGEHAFFQGLAPYPEKQGETNGATG